MNVPLELRKCNEVSSLRSFLESRPNNAKALAKLAMCLVEKHHKGKHVVSSSLQEEALSLANRAVEIAPNKYFTHMTLSEISSDVSLRKRALLKSIELIEEENSNIKDSSILLALNLTRLLIEPREEKKRIWIKNEKRNAAGKMCKDPSRIDINISHNEILIYQKLKQKLEICWNKVKKYDHGVSSFTEENLKQLINIEYRLGLLFRTMEPKDKHKKNSIFHFLRAVDSSERISHSDDIINKSQFWLATLNYENKEKKIEKCPEEYIVSLYSSFAERFDDLLVSSLDYQTPTILRKVMDGVKPPDKSISRGLDLGCGTGLSGIAFRDCIGSYLEGVDLSPEMIQKAKLRECYDSLKVADVEAALLSHKNSLGDKDSGKFDLIFACDVFVYIGELERIFSYVRSLLSSDGLFAFSVELLPETVDTQPYLLQATARFAHKQSYLESLATKNNFGTRYLGIHKIRKNKGHDILGILAIFDLKIN